MKKKIYLLLLCLSVVMLSACRKSGKEVIEQGKFWECQRGFMDGIGNRMYETPEGYYFLMGNYLMFADKSFERSTIVCDKVECLHNNEAPEKKLNCNAFFSCATALSFYNEKLYVLSDNINKSGRISVKSIYEVSLDGTERKEIYSGSEGMLSFCIHQGNAYIYEKKYADEDGNVRNSPVLSITKIPMKNPKKKEILFESDKYGDGDINNLCCYQENCYFEIISEELEIQSTILNLETKKISKCPIGMSCFGIGKEKMYGVKAIKIDDELAWKSLYYECKLDGTAIKELTEEKFPILKKDTMPKFVDDEYIYFSDINYGKNEVPEKERKLYVCTHDGELICEILYPDVMTMWGNEQYLFYFDMEGENEVLYKVDKNQFGKGAEFEAVFNSNGEDYMGVIMREQ